MKFRFLAVCLVAAPACLGGGPTTSSSSATSAELAAGWDPGGSADTDVTCDTLHAVKIAREVGLDDCDTARISSSGEIEAVAAGAELGAVGRSACRGLTANDCARYFRTNAADGLLDGNNASGAKYTAYHYGDLEDLRLPDGTRPMLYFKAGSGEHADDWVIFLQGGAGMCSSDVVQVETERGTSSFEPQGTACYDKTDYAEQAEKAAGTGFNRARYKDFSGDGILGDHANNSFKDYNRVYVMKSNDLWVGATTKQALVVNVERQIAGLKTWRAASMQLRGDAVVKAALAFLAVPPAGVSNLSRARNVLFVSSSSGTNAVQRVDDWRSDIAAYTNPNVHVAMMVNSSAVTADSFTLEDVDDNACGSIYSGDCANFDDPPRGTTLDLITTGAQGRRLQFGHRTWLDYEATHWDGTSERQIAPGSEAKNYESVGARLDASCVAAETAHPWKCRSPLYVMLNHLKTPLFVAHSLRDASNADGVVRGVESRRSDGTIPRWSTVTWPPGHANEGEAPMESLARLQFRNWVDNRDNAIGGAAGDSKHAGPLGVWASDCDHHEPEKHDRPFSSGDVKIGDPADNTSHVVTLNEALRAWFEDGTEMIRIDGYGQSDTVYTSKPLGCQDPSGDGH